MSDKEVVSLTRKTLKRIVMVLLGIALLTSLTLMEYPYVRTAIGNSSYYRAGVPLELLSPIIGIFILHMAVFASICISLRKD